MKHKQLIGFILSQPLYKWLLILLWGALASGLLLKSFLWPALRIDFLTFFALAGPLAMVVINLQPYSFYSNWISLCEKFKDRSEIRKNLKVHIRNFDPWKGLSKTQNWFQFSRPFYDFEKADILESENLIIIYGQNDALLSNHKNTRPFGLAIGDAVTTDPDLYLVKLISMSNTKECKEIVFVDRHYVGSGQIKMLIYNK